MCGKSIYLNQKIGLSVTPNIRLGMEGLAFGKNIVAGMYVYFQGGAILGEDILGRASTEPLSIPHAQAESSLRRT